MHSGWQARAKRITVSANMPLTASAVIQISWTGSGHFTVKSVGEFDPYDVICERLAICDSVAPASSACPASEEWKSAPDALHPSLSLIPLPALERWCCPRPELSASFCPNHESAVVFHPDASVHRGGRFVETNGNNNSTRSFYLRGIFQEPSWIGRLAILLALPRTSASREPTPASAISTGLAYSRLLFPAGFTVLAVSDGWVSCGRRRFHSSIADRSAQRSAFQAQGFVPGNRGLNL